MSVNLVLPKQENFDDELKNCDSAADDEFRSEKAQPVQDLASEVTNESDSVVSSITDTFPVLKAIQKPFEWFALAGIERYPWDIPYPKSVLFIVCNEFCERFTFYGLRTVLALYLSHQLKFDNDQATVIYHVFIMLCYFFPFLGAMIADNWLGRFRSIFYLSIVYAFGSILLSVAAIPNIIPPTEFTMVGLLLIALGTGGIKPCVSAFGGDQFVLPQQEEQLQKFFSLFYFSINSGSLLSTFITPILREDVKCFGEESCFSLAFGVPAILMIVALAVFLFGKKWYKMKNPEGNIIVQVVKCISHAICSKTTEKRDHWLYKADDKFDRKFIEDIIATLSVLVLYIPLPVFWALFDQQGSRWTFQATRMKIDVAGIRIKPDQMQVVNPILILIFIPIFEKFLYPLLAKCNLLRRPLQKLTFGGILAAAAFGVSALVEIKLEETYPVLPESGEGQLRLYNVLPCDLEVNFGDSKNNTINLKSMAFYEDLHINVKNFETIKLKVLELCNMTSKDYSVTIHEGKATSFAITLTDTSTEIVHEDIDKTSNGDPKLMIYYSDGDKNFENSTVVFNPVSGNKAFTFYVEKEKTYTEFSKLAANEYVVEVDKKEIGNVLLEQGGIYTMVIMKEAKNKDLSHEVLVVTKPNSVSILWLIPQYVIMTAGEIMFSITGLEFSFTQAPASMKSLLQAVWLSTVAIGNLVVVVVAEAKIFKSQTYEFILFASLMLIDMFIFALMAMRYTYVEDFKDCENHELNTYEKDEDEKK